MSPNFKPYAVEITFWDNASHCVLYRQGLRITHKHTKNSKTIMNNGKVKYKSQNVESETKTDDPTLPWPPPSIVAYKHAMKIARLSR